MKKSISIIISALFLPVLCFAECASDHFLIGCNADGIFNTADDDVLFVDCSTVYRHSDPNDSKADTWKNWFYPLYYTDPPPYTNPRYSNGEPGFDLISDTNRQLSGAANIDYKIIIKCLSITSGFTARKSTLGILLDEPGDFIDHSSLIDKHLHLEYRAPVPQGGTDLQWITFYIYDQFGTYQPAQPFSVVFVKDPPAGDLIIDGVVDIYDLAEFAYYWLEDSGSRANDYYERADANKNGKVDFADFALLAENWLD